MEVAGTAVSGFSFLALAAEVEGAGVLPVDDGDFSVFSLGLSFSRTLSVLHSFGGSGREPDWVVEDVELDVEVALECEADVLL